LPRKEDVSSPTAAGTPAYTGAAKNDNAGSLETLATALLGLSPADRANLVALLLGRPSE
jgi:hypothetical protein